MANFLLAHKAIGWWAKCVNCGPLALIYDVCLVGKRPYLPINLNEDVSIYNHWPQKNAEIGIFLGWHMKIKPNEVFLFGKRLERRRFYNQNTEIRIFLGLHMMIRESFWHKTLFTNQPNEDVSIYKYVFSWGEKHCPPPNYWVIRPQHRFRCKTTMLSSKSPDHHVSLGSVALLS